MRKNITVISDASFEYSTGKGGYAFYVEVGGKEYKMYGAFEDKLTNPTEAEMKCILNALYFIRHKGFKANVIDIITDCEFIAKHMFKKKKGRNRKISDLSNRIKQYLGNIDHKKANFIHVKAHTDEIDSYKKFVNDWCDRMSKEGREI